MKKRLILVLGALCCTMLFALACSEDKKDDGDGEATATTASQETPAVQTPDGEEPTDTPESNGAPAGAIDACSLLSTEDIEGALGGPSDPPQQSDIGESFNQCLWRIQGGTDLDAAVIVQARGDTSREDFDRLVDENSPEELGPVTPISGLGDAAAQGLVATFVLQGDAMVVVQILSDITVEQQQEVARTAIGRLP